jgi:1A family penicillin-binding protein
MQSRELPQYEIGGDSRAEPPPDAPYSPILKTLPPSVLMRVLANRSLTAVRDRLARLGNAFSRLKLRMKSDAGLRNMVQASLRHRRGLLLAAVLALLPAAYLAYCIATIPFAGASSILPAPSAMVFEADDGQPFAMRGILKGQGIAAERIPTLLAGAVTAVEDRRFYQHGGIDLRAITRAAWHDLTGRRLEGGSTITQQLARRLYLSPDRTLKRKVQEAVLAEWLDLAWSKNEILADYLNTVYFGDGAYGADSAAERYFGKCAQQLSLSEAAMLAGLIKAPSELEPDRNPAGAQQRAAVVLDAMVTNGAVTQQQADDARQRPAVLRAPPEALPGSSYFLDTAANEAKSRIGPSTEDLTIRTTLDPELQRLAETIIAKRLAAAEKAKNVHQAALVAMTPDGAIVAMVGGRDYTDSQFNRVTQARRQPGSLFKAFVYLTAMRKGYTPDSVIVDQPVNIGDWEPDNYGDHFFGPVTLRTAFAHSLNSVAVQLAQSVGIRSVIDTARQLGVRSDLPAVPSVALGSGAVTPLEMTRAFAAIATNTTNIDGYALREITKDNQTVYSRPMPELAATDSANIHAEMLDLLSSVVREGTGTAARLDQPVGGKTGTSEDYHDAWFVGFTSDLVVGVWAGNDDNTPMNSVTGGSLPATIWHDFVSAAETARRPSAGPVTAMGGMPSARTISFASAGTANSAATQSRYTGGWQPFRFLFRF